MSNCNKISELLSAYIDNEVTAKEKELVESHIKDCTSCKQKLDLMIKTKDILKDSPQIPVPETLLKDFEEYRKKSEQTEKKIVPFYKNYRVYASVAAIFVFAFVLKSGLWQEDKFVPDTLTQSKVTEQSIVAPADNAPSVSEDTPVAEKEATTTTNKKESANKPASQPKATEQTAPAEEKALTPKQETTRVVSDDVQPPQIESKNAPAVAEAVSEDGEGIAAYDETQSVSPMARTIDAPPVAEVKAPSHAIVYVAEEDLAKAARLLSEGEYFYAQVAQKLNDNRIPFESNFLSLDEGVPHKVVVMVRE